MYALARQVDAENIIYSGVLELEYGSIERRHVCTYSRVCAETTAKSIKKKNIYKSCICIYTMKWIFFALLWVCTFCEEASVIYCIPFELKSRIRQDLLDESTKCLRNNFNWNTLGLEPWVDSYMTALEAKNIVEKLDSSFFYIRRELMLTLRDIQFRSTHHMHAIHQCAAIGHRIPKYILESYTDDTQLTVKAIGLWNHHITQDVTRCIRLVRVVISNEQKHMEHHLIEDQINYEHQLALVLAARTEADKRLATMHHERQQIINSLV